MVMSNFDPYLKWLSTIISDDNQQQWNGQIMIVHQLEMLGHADDRF